MDFRLQNINLIFQFQKRWGRNNVYNNKDNALQKARLFESFYMSKIFLYLNPNLTPQTIFESITN